MVTCPKCNKELSEETRFCDACGTKLEKAVPCPESKEACSTPAKKSLVETVKETVMKLPKKAILFGGIGAAAVAVIVVLIVVISLLFGGKKQNDYVMYLKEQEIFYSALKKNSNPWQVTSRLVDTDDVEDGDLADSGYFLAYLTYITEDGKYIFFPDKIGDEGFNLYFRKVGNEKDEPIKIDSDIQSYAVNKAATVVTYLKGEEGNLYQYNIKKDTKEKIASDVAYFKISEDGNKIFYMNSEDTLYLKTGKEDKEKIAGEVSSVEYLSEDFKTVYYVKDDTLYKQVIGKEKEKIASDVYDVIKIYDSGELYYFTYELVEEALMNYVNDDMAAADAEIIQPEYPEYPQSPSRPYSWNYDTTEEYEAAYEAYQVAYEEWEIECDTMREAYNAAKAAYNEKRTRDTLRESLEENTFEHKKYSLYFYDGEEKILVTDAYAGYPFSSYYDVAEDRPVISYTAYKKATFNKVNLSELDSAYEVSDMVNEALYTDTEAYLTVKANAAVVDKEAPTKLTINDAGTLAYYFDDIPEGEDYGTLYQVAIGKDSAGKPEEYDTDVYTGYSYFATDDKLVYYKDYKNEKGELYINKEKIDYEVWSVLCVEDNTVVYFTDWNEDKEYGTLKIYQKGKATKIADDVHNAQMGADGKIFYLSDYSLNYYKGELYQWDNGKGKKIDEDVMAILPAFTSTQRSNLYGW